MSGYISKDFIHEGCGLPLNPTIVWDFIPYSVQKNIKKAIKQNVRIDKVDGKPEDIEILKNMWYDPEDPNMPHQLNYTEHMFIAYNDSQEPIGAVILLPVGNHLFLNNLAGNKKGKEIGIQDYLLWHCVNHFQESKFKYIDVGVSYRPTLYKFFTKWKVFSYPVIFNKPKIKLDVPFYPFKSNDYNAKSDDIMSKSALARMLGITQSSSSTFVPNDEFAKVILEENGFTPLNMTYNLSKIGEKVCYINLPELFSTQFGAIIFNLEIDDKKMWNDYHCLDVFKREYVLSQIYNEIDSFGEIIAKRNQNFSHFSKLFGIEDIKGFHSNFSIKDIFRFTHNLNNRFHNKLNEFGIEHYYDSSLEQIGLPIHHQLTTSQLDYLYGIFRGILNLCSEWEHTDNYQEYK